MVMMAGCYKDPAYTDLSSSFTVTTNRDLKANFASYKTFHISDSVRFISEKSKDSVIMGGDAKTLVDAVKSNLIARGYTFVLRNAKPDLGINLIVIRDVDAGVIYPGWWYGYGYWGWWGGYYPYYPYAIPYVITSGNVVIDMVDVKAAPTDQKLTTIWNAFIGGGLASTTSMNVTLSVEGINQAFTQSAYIQTTH